MQDHNLSTGPTVVITGAGSGLGEAMARVFANRGYRVGVCDIDADRAVRVSSEIEAISPGGFWYEMDICETAHWDSLHERVHQAWGGLNVLVNNAGIAAAGNCEDTSIEDWRWVIDTDLMGVVHGCHRFIPSLRKAAQSGSHRCHLINVSSFAGIAGMAGMCAYGVAKAGVIALSEQLRAELSGSGVGVSVVCPAFVKTRLLETFRANDSSHRQRVERWMENATVTADEVASQTLAAMDANKFMVLTHPITKRAWRLKRWLPEAYFRQVAKAVNRQNSQTDRSKQA